MNPIGQTGSKLLPNIHEDKNLKGQFEDLSPKKAPQNQVVQGNYKPDFKIKQVDFNDDKKIIKNAVDNTHIKE